MFIFCVPVFEGLRCPPPPAAYAGNTTGVVGGLSVRNTATLGGGGGFLMQPCRRPFSPQSPTADDPPEGRGAGFHVLPSAGSVPHRWSGPHPPGAPRRGSSAMVKTPLWVQCPIVVLTTHRAAGSNRVDGRKGWKRMKEWSRRPKNGTAGRALGEEAVEGIRNLPPSKPTFTRNLPRNGHSDTTHNSAICGGGGHLLPSADRRQFSELFRILNPRVRNAKFQ